MYSKVFDYNLVYFTSKKKEEHKRMSIGTKKGKSMLYSKSFGSRINADLDTETLNNVKETEGDGDDSDFF